MANFGISQELTTTAGKVLTITGIEKRLKKDADGNSVPNGIVYVVSIEGEEKRLTSDKIKALCGIALNSTGEGKKSLLESAAESDITAIYQRLQSEFEDACIKIATRFQFSEGMANDFLTATENTLPTLEDFTARWHEVQKEREEKRKARETQKAKARITAKARKLFDGMDAATRAMMLEILKAQQSTK